MVVRDRDCNRSYLVDRWPVAAGILTRYMEASKTWLTKKRFLKLLAISFGLLGCFFGAMAGLRIEQIFTQDSFSLGWGRKCSGFWWDHALLFSFISGGFGFVLEFFGLLLVDRATETLTAEKPFRELKLIPNDPRSQVAQTPNKKLVTGFLIGLLLVGVALNRRHKKPGSLKSL